MENSICGSFPGEPHGTRWCCSFAACFATPASRGCWRRPLIWAAGEPWKWWPSSQMHSLTSPAWTSMTRRCLKVCLGMPWYALVAGLWWTPWKVLTWKEKHAGCERLICWDGFVFWRMRCGVTEACSIQTRYCCIVGHQNQKGSCTFTCSSFAVQKHFLWLNL